MTAVINRRTFDRFALKPMYTRVCVQRIVDGRMRECAGHAYDVSEGGLRIDLDERLVAGERVNVSLNIPVGGGNPESPIHLACETVWTNDVEDDPILPRMALRIVKYLGDDSRDRLLRLLGSGLVARAA